ncbi:MAG TPA: hypothetical protein VGB42_00385 [Candidatus Thermoplasmatota archaeon]
MSPKKPGAYAGVVVGIVVTVVLILVILVLALLYLSAPWGPTFGPPSSKTTVSLSAGQWNADANTVLVVAVSSATVEASTLTYQIIAPNGTIYYSGPSGSQETVNGVTTTVTYLDTGGEGYVGPDDSIRIEVSPSAGLVQVHGTTFKVLQGADVLGTIFLP